MCFHFFLTGCSIDNVAAIGNIFLHNHRQVHVFIRLGGDRTQVLYRSSRRSSRKIDKLLDGRGGVLGDCIDNVIAEVSGRTSI